MSESHNNAFNDDLLPTELRQLRQAVADSFVAGASGPDGVPGRARPHQVGDWQQQQQLLQHATATHKPVYDA
jgi:hypothetical protein